MALVHSERFALRWSPAVVAAALLGCATVPPESQASARRHARNLAAAEQAGYTIVDRDGQTLFCSAEAPTGSHIAPGCLTEDRWEQAQLWVWRRPAWAGEAQSGRSPTEGTLDPHVDR
jgi:hypothetical protein